MQSFDNTRKKYIKIKNEPEIESLEMHNSFQGSSSLQLELDSKEVDPDFVAVELKNEMKELEEGNSSQLQMLSNNIFGIKTEPTTLSLEQEINAFSAEFNIKSENEGDYSQINSRGSKTQSSSSRSHSLYSEYSESVDSIIACLDSGSSQQGLNLVSDLEEASDSEKRRKTLTVQLKNGELVVLTNSRKASWTGRQKNKSEFQLYENQVELWESLTRRTQDQLKEHNSEEFQRAIKKKCRDRETLGIKLNNGERVTLDHNKTIGWNQFTEEEKNELRKLGEEDFFKEINKKAQEAKSLKITLTPEGSENIEVSLNTNQAAAWNKLSEEKKQELKSLEKEKFFKEINKKVKEGQSLKIILTPEGGQDVAVSLNAHQAVAWNKLSEEKRQELQGFGEETFFKKINKKVQEGRSIKIILTPERGKNIEVSLNAHQVTAWNKLSKEKRQELKSLEKEKFFKEINKEAAKNRSLKIVFESGEKANLALDLVHFWKLLSAEEQALRKTGNAQALLRELKDMYNQEARTKRLATKKTSKSPKEMNLMETSSANQDSNEMAAETLGREEDLATSEAFEANEDEKHSRGSVKRKRIAEETKDDDSPIIIQHYVLPPKKRKIYSVKEEPREIYEEENNANINDVPSKLSSATVTEHVGKSKEGKAL